MNIKELKNKNKCTLDRVVLNTFCSAVNAPLGGFLKGGMHHVSRG
jgi:hypothetical protein